MQILAFGEILWDVFSDKKEIGGTALNFGAHLARLGADVDLVTAVGCDTNGNDALQTLDRFKISRQLACINQYPTGFCKVTTNSAGLPTYDLAKDVAYDHIELDNNGYTMHSILVL